MTTQELSKLIGIENEIKLLHKEIEELSTPRTEDRYGTDGVLSSSKEIPYQQRIQLVQGYATHVLPLSAELKEKIKERKERLKNELIRREEERMKLEQYICSIPDSLTRQIFRLRFIEGKRWNEIADAVGGKNTEDSVRKAVTRYTG